MPIDKNTQAQASLWEYFCTFLPDKPDLFPILSCYTFIGPYRHSLDQLSCTIHMVKRIQMRMMETLKKHASVISYIGSSYTVCYRGTMRSPVVDVICILYPKTPILV